MTTMYPQHSDPGCMGWTVDFSSRHYVGSAMAYYAKRGTGGEGGGLK